LILRIFLCLILTDDAVNLLHSLWKVEGSCYLQIYAERLTASQMEVARLESVTDDLVNERIQLQEVVTNLSERNSCLKSECRDAHCREEQLRDEIIVAGAKILELEEAVAGSESKVDCSVLYLSHFVTF
jgi:predicted  nucleic acid-binding Zn-ribbon protein